MIDYRVLYGVAGLIGSLAAAWDSHTHARAVKCQRDLARDAMRGECADWHSIRINGIAEFSSAALPPEHEETGEEQHDDDGV